MWACLSPYRRCRPSQCSAPFPASAKNVGRPIPCTQRANQWSLGWFPSPARRVLVQPIPGLLLPFPHVNSRVALVSPSCFNSRRQPGAGALSPLSSRRHREGTNGPVPCWFQASLGNPQVLLRTNLYRLAHDFMRCRQNLPAHSQPLVGHPLMSSYFLGPGGLGQPLPGITGR